MSFIKMPHTHIHLEKDASFDSVGRSPFIRESRFMIHLPEDMDALEEIGMGILAFVKSQKEATP